MLVEKVIDELKAASNPEYINKLDHFGIDSAQALGLRTPQIKEIAKAYKKDHTLAIKLWNTPIHEAKLLSIFVDDPKQVSEEQMEKMVSDFYSWDLVDQACINLFCKHKLAFDKVFEWAELDGEYERRTSFALIAVLAIHAKKVPDSEFEKFFPLIETYCTDERNFVKKAVNWALRGLGKRSIHLHQLAIECAENMLLLNNKAAQWNAKNTLQELKNEKIIKRLKN